jgi:DNA excision repair protein ERCC-4
MARKNISTTPVEPAPFTLIIDSREQKPYAFDGLAPTVTRALKAGDYSIVGHEFPTPGDGFVIERKSIDDAFKTIISARDRFVRELEKLRLYRYAAILIEGSLRDILAFTSPGAINLSDKERAGRPRAVVNSLNSWQIEYGVHVLYVDRDRDLCRAQVLRLAERFWRMKHEKANTNPTEAPAA